MERITTSLLDIERELTAHAQGYKQVFLRANDSHTKVTQVAYGEFSKVDYCEMHVHETMEEFFFFTEGLGNYIVGNQYVDLFPGVFVRIPAGVSHRLETISEVPLKYLYFGVATD